MVLTRDVHKNPILLFSTDLTIPTVKIIEFYAARWKIEIAFRDIKEMGKMGDYRFYKYCSSIFTVNSFFH
jgi:GMP synthase PP-ATPase subunit